MGKSRKKSLESTGKVSEPAVLARGYRSANAKVVKAAEFKAKCLELMDEVNERHVSVVITKRGVPVATLVPVESSPPSPFGFMRGTVVDDTAIVDAEHDVWQESGTDPLA